MEYYPSEHLPPEHSDNEDVHPSDFLAEPVQNLHLPLNDYSIWVINRRKWKKNYKDVLYQLCIFGHDH
jgi:hypothetical protein